MQSPKRSQPEPNKAPVAAVRQPLPPQAPPVTPVVPVVADVAPAAQPEVQHPPAPTVKGPRIEILPSGNKLEHF